MWYDGIVGLSEWLDTRHEGTRSLIGTWLTEHKDIS